jgi:hypothetical protein
MIHAERIDGEWEIRTDGSRGCLGHGHTLDEAKQHAIRELHSEIVDVEAIDGDDSTLTISTTIHTGTARASRHVGA